MRRYKPALAFFQTREAARHESHVSGILAKVERLGPVRHLPAHTQGLSSQIVHVLFIAK